MLVEKAPFYESPRSERPYTDWVQFSIPSLGTYYDGLRVPDLLLTLYYTQDPKTGDLLQGEKFMKFVFQTDGPSNCDLNFPHDSLDTHINNWFCRFDARMDITFGAGVTNKTSGTLGGSIGVDKVVKAGVEGSVEKGTEGPGTRTTLHAHIHGSLDVRRGGKGLTAWGEMTGAAQHHRS